jgi:hypothetical protein
VNIGKKGKHRGLTPTHYVRKYMIGYLYGKDFKAFWHEIEKIGTTWVAIRKTRFNGLKSQVLIEYVFNLGYGKRSKIVFRFSDIL